jgi:hypothetical protein
MQASPPEPRTPGVCYAATDEGLELPAVDITHPAFACDPSPEEIAAQAARFLRESAHQQRLPRFLRERIVPFFLRRSRLGRGLLASSGTFLDGATTYLLKLGPENLGGFGGKIDRKIVDSFPALAVRLRLRDMAHLLADGLVPALRARPGAPCHLLNLAGGPAADSWNALILLHREQPQLLAERAIRITVLDLDTAGPDFGRRALAALQDRGGPLHGLEVDFRHLPYDWRRTEDLRHELERLEPGAVAAASSEGGLFEYGTDEEIVANLRALHRGTPDDAVMVGSVTRADGPARLVAESTGVATLLRGIEAFRPLARQAGWEIERSHPRPFSDNLRLRKSGR